jgi:hypothetical protein
MPSMSGLSRSILSGSSERESARARKALWAIEDGSPLAETYRVVVTFDHEPAEVAE